MANAKTNKKKRKNRTKAKKNRDISGGTTSEFRTLGPVLSAAPSLESSTSSFEDISYPYKKKMKLEEYETVKHLL